MSGHLVLPLRALTSPQDLMGRLREAHRFLVAAARATVPRLLDLPSDAWGASVKREHVALPQLGRPPLVSPSIPKHGFVEVLNQCATLERLIDALAWVETVGELKGAKATTCNPTTTPSLWRRRVTVPFA